MQGAPDTACRFAALGALPPVEPVWLTACRCDAGGAPPPPSQGLLEGVKGELDELEPWVAEDVDTVWNAATSMAVILNDVLDLGQVRPTRRAARPCGGRTLLTRVHFVVCGG